MNRQKILDLYNDLRVADVRDGMDWCMLHATGSMSPEIRPLYRTRAVGIARTARYLPYQGTIPQMTPDQYTEWVGWYYNTVCTYPWMAEIEPGDFAVLDLSGVDVGLMGSNNGLDCKRAGARGIISSDGLRDTDELILQQVPCWSRYCSQPMVQGRIQYSAHNVPVSVGGVAVFPGDVIVADGDGVVVVPQARTEEVAFYADRELRNDKAGRRRLYESMGMELDDTVK